MVRAALVPPLTCSQNCATILPGTLADSASGVALGLLVSVDCKVSFLYPFLLSPFPTREGIRIQPKKKNPHQTGCLPLGAV